MRKLNVKAIKAEINRLVEAIRCSDDAFKRRRHLIRYTKLCALRASMRGKLHFSQTTNLIEAFWILGLGKIKHADFKFAGVAPKFCETYILHVGGRRVSIKPRVFSNVKNLTEDGESVRHYASISKKLQAEWVADVAAEFTMETTTAKKETEAAA